MAVRRYSPVKPGEYRRPGIASPVFAAARRVLGMASPFCPPPLRPCPDDRLEPPGKAGSRLLTLILNLPGLLAEIAS
jgi:hypothetical protein